MHRNFALAAMVAGVFCAAPTSADARSESECLQFVSPAMSDAWKSKTLADCMSEPDAKAQPAAPTPAAPASAYTEAMARADRARYAAHLKNPQAWARQAKSHMQRSLKDPPAARFEGLYVSVWRPNAIDRYPVLCGVVNAKNAYGGYIGAQRFYANGETSVTYELDYPASFADGWAENCGSKIADVK